MGRQLWTGVVLVLLSACGAPLEPAEVDGIWVATRYYGQSLPVEQGSLSIKIVVLADTLRLDQGGWYRLTAQTLTDLGGATYQARQPRYAPLEQRGFYGLGPSEVRLQVPFCEDMCDHFWVGKLREDGRLVFDGGMEYIRG